MNGRAASDELNPYWFNTELVTEFLEARKAGNPVAWPTIRIELFLENRDGLQHLCGAINTDQPTNACPGVSLQISPHPGHSEDLEQWLRYPSHLLPVEYYSVDWRSFADTALLNRPSQLATAIIDSRTLRSSTGIDYHMRNILNDRLLPAERAEISLAYRDIKAKMSENVLKRVNERMAEEHASLHERSIELAMDQSARTSWEGAVTPHVDNVPFSMSGQGQQAAIKIALALGQSSERTNFVMVEEPENHLTHTSLATLLSRIERLAGEHQQLFIATHSSYVINRLGLNGLHLLGETEPFRLTELEPETVSYFRKLPGYDTLRMVLADKVVLVEGPSDEIIFERLFLDRHGQRPIELEIDVISMRGLSFRRCLELCRALDKTVAAIRDNDGISPEEHQRPLEHWLEEGRRRLFVGAANHGRTLEPQLLHQNGEEKLRRVLGVPDHADLNKWMAREKTEAAIRIADSEDSIVPPTYMIDAAEFVRL